MSVVQVSLRCRGRPDSSAIEDMHHRGRRCCPYEAAFYQIISKRLSISVYYIHAELSLLPDVILTPVKVIHPIMFGCLTLIDDSSTKGSRSASRTLQTK